MRWPAWLGVGERRWKKSPNEEVQPPKTAWDFLQLLIVPGILVVIALAFNASQASRERGREDRRIREDRALAEETREDAILDAYLAKMSGLILDRHLRSAGYESAVSRVARTATLTTLRRLDGSRKGEVVRFLYEAGLLRYGRGGAAFYLGGADLRGVDLAGVSLTSYLTPAGEVDKDDVTTLGGDLRGARFDHAELDHVDFAISEETDLRGASFNGAFIYDTTFRGVDLRGASFNEANLGGVDFDGADLRGTTFHEADVGGWGDATTTFDRTCLSKASFAGTSFNLFTDTPVSRTTFIGAEGQSVDFSHARKLSAVVLGVGVKARFDGAEERPTISKESGEFACPLSRLDN